MIKPLDNPADRTERLAKSIVVQDKAVLFVDSFTAQLGADLATLYMHRAMCHLPEMVLRFEVDISDMSQQFVEAKLKEGKTDMQLFTNKRLKDERQEKGRVYQVMAKGRERVALRKKVLKPMSRNERRQLGDGSKGAEQTVERAQRRGVLVSGSQLQINTKISKLAPEIGRVYLAYKEIIQQLTSLGEEEAEEEPEAAPGPSTSFNMASNTAAGNLLPTGPAAAGAATAAAAPAAEIPATHAAGRGAGRGGAAAAASGTGRGGAGGRGQGAQAGRGAGDATTGRGPGIGAPAAAGRGARGRGAGGRGSGRGRGRTTGGRAIPALAREL
jgi:hypothetical protein